MPLPGFTQASSVLGLLAARKTIGSPTANAKTDIQAMRRRLVNVMVMLLSFLTLDFTGSEQSMV